MNTTLTTPRRLAVGIAAVLLAGGLAACGDDGGDGGDSGDSGGSAEEFCSVGDDLDAFSSTDEIDNDQFQSALDDAVDAAPDEIKDDVETVREAFADVDLSDPQALTDPDVQETFTSPEFKEASSNLDAYVKDNCEPEETADDGGTDSGN